MSSLSRGELLVFGYVREEYCSKNDTEYPDDLSQLFLAWLSWIDQFDKTTLHKALTLIAESKVGRDDFWHDMYSSAFGKSIVSKGQKRQWTIQLTRKKGLIGIIQNDIIEASDQNGIEDFSDSKHKGYALSLEFLHKYHASGGRSDGVFQYAECFDLTDEILLSMELDLTSTKGILSITFLMDQGKCDGVRSTSNILYDDIDCDKSYRAAICFTDDAFQAEFVHK